MFRQLSRWLQEQAAQVGAPVDVVQKAPLAVFLLHPLALARFLEEAWFVRDNRDQKRPSLALDDPALPISSVHPPGSRSSALAQLQSFLDNWVKNVGDSIYPLPCRVGTGLWDHLIYAYMIENTRIYEIFRRVIFEYAHGERLDVPSSQGEHWLRATEDLFYKDAPPFSIQSLTSWVRPDISAARRNAYWRMFGMDLNHGSKEGGAYPYEKAEAANRDFVPTFEILLREVWRGIENFRNEIGPNATDDAAIATLAERLFHMFQVRRRNGNLSREEFFYVATMSWMHLTVEFDSPIVQDLKAQATSPEERLRKIGERVGIPAHGRSESYFRMAEPLARILNFLETGLFNTPDGAKALYIEAPPPPPPPAPKPPPPPRADMLTIITHWSLATGRDMKALPVRASVPAAAMPNGQVRPPVPALPAS
jgi:hypothetical protein